MIRRPRPRHPAGGILLENPRHTRTPLGGVPRNHCPTPPSAGTTDGRFRAYAPTFAGQFAHPRRASLSPRSARSNGVVRVAVGDVTGDTISDYVPRSPGRGSRRALTRDRRRQPETSSFPAFDPFNDPNFRGGGVRRGSGRSTPTPEPKWWSARDQGRRGAGQSLLVRRKPDSHTGPRRGPSSGSTTRTSAAGRGSPFGGREQRRVRGRGGSRPGSSAAPRGGPVQRARPSTPVTAQRRLVKRLSSRSTGAERAHAAERRVCGDRGHQRGRVSRT